eukprot:UN10490
MSDGSETIILMNNHEQNLMLKKSEIIGPKQFQDVLLTLPSRYHCLNYTLAFTSNLDGTSTITFLEKLIIYQP